MKRKAIEEQKIEGGYRAVAHDNGVTFVCLTCGEGLLFIRECSLEEVTVTLKWHRSKHVGVVVAGRVEKGSGSILVIDSARRLAYDRSEG